MTTKKELPSETDTSKLSTNRPTAPEVSRRIAKRIDVRYGDGLSARIITESDEEEIQAQVFDISLKGLALVVSNRFAHMFDTNKSYDIIIYRSWSTPISVVCKCFRIGVTENDKLKLGFEFEQSTDTESISDTAKMLEIPAQLPIIGYMYKDFFYNERVALFLRKISYTHMVFDMKDTEIILFPEMVTNMSLAVRTSSGENIKIKVLNINVKKTHAEVTATILDFPKHLATDLVSYFLTETSITPDNLRSAAFKVKNISNNFKFRYIKSEAEYTEVLNLRLLAYRSVGKADPETNITHMQAPLDNISRILAAYHGDKLVGTCAMSFPHSKYIRLDTERTLPNGYPEDLPDKLKVMEISRLCINPEYRRGDLLVRMFQHMYRVFLVSDREYALTSTEKKMWPIYKNIGFTKTAHVYEHPVFHGIKHTIIFINKKTPFQAHNLSAPKWNYLYRDMTDFVRNRNRMDYSFWHSLKVKIYKVIGKLMGIRTDKY